MKENRLLYLDVLKLFATLGVILIHVAVDPFRNHFGEMVWYAAGLWDGISRWSVPVFIMVSGAVILPICKNGIEKMGFSEFVKKFYVKRIGRLLLACFVWGVLYDASLKLDNISNWSVMDVFWILVSPFVTAYVHIWFLPMIISMYVFAPLLVMFINDEKRMLYFLLIWLVSICMNAFPYVEFRKYLNIGYVGYFVLGYYLANKEFSVRIKRLLYLFGCIALLVILVGTIYMSYRSGGTYIDLHYYLILPMVAFSVAVFILFKNIIGEQKVWTRITGFCRKDLFGVYLMHMFMLEAVVYIMKVIGVENTAITNGFLELPLMAVVVFVFSLFATKLLRMIPGVWKIVE